MIDEMSGFRFGDDEALRALYEDHGALIYSYCHRVVGPNQAADVTQEVFISAWRSRENFDSTKGTFAVWLMTIAKRRCIDALRRSGRRPEFAADTTDPETEPATEDIAELEQIADRHRIEPPPSIWIAIVDTVSADRDGRPDRTLTLTDNGNGSVVADITPIEQQATTTISLAARRRPIEQPVLPPEMSAWRRQWLPVAAAVAVAIVGGLVTWAFSDELAGGTGAGGTGASVELDGEVVAVAAITGDDLGDGTDEATRRGEVGEARLVRSGDRYYLDLDLPDLPEVDGYLELWITDPTDRAMFSLGVVTGDGRYALPGNLDPASYPVVDVSVEPIDGDPTHSGQRLWRGVLDL